MEKIIKYSGIEWIGKIPECWSIKKIKYCCNIYTGNSISDNKKDNYCNPEAAIPYIATKDIDVENHVVNYDNGLYIPMDNKSFRLAPENSSLLCIEGSSAGKKLGYTDRQVCFVNKLCCFHTNNSYISKFLFYMLQSDIFLVDFNLKMTGLIGGVSQNTIKNICIINPSMQEQQQIADFLDKKCEKIDRVVETQKGIIEKLKEYKQSVITEVVTKGLNKTVPLKDSDIEWIGKIPQHWGICRLKNYAKIQNGQDFKSVEDEDGIVPVIGSGGEFAQANECLYEGESVLLGRKGTIDKPLYVNCAFWTVDTMYYTELKNITFGKFFYYLCKIIKFDFYQYGSAVPSITQRDLNSVQFPFVNYDEQQQIAEYLDKECSEIDSIISNKKQLIEKLTEYKKSLIYECVTGKRKVI